MSNYVTEMTVDLDCIEHNYKTVAEYVKPAQVIAVVKGNAYGHGIVPVSRVLVESGCRTLAVAKMSEGLRLRRAGISADVADVLVMGLLLPQEIDVAIRERLSLFIGDFSRLSYVRQASRASEFPLKIHIKVDTGMGRAGFLTQDAAELRSALKDLGNCCLIGFATHLHAPAEWEPTRVQMERFSQFLEQVGAPQDCLIHMASSSAVASFRETIRGGVRVGDLVYGLCGVDNAPFHLKPALTYRSRVVQTKELPEGWHVGYGTGRWVRDKTRVALVPIGTGDGMMSIHAGRTSMLIHGKRCPVLAVCADTTILGTGGIEDVRLEDEVVFIGSQGDETISAREQARAAGTGFSELLAKISLRVPRVYLRHGRYAGTLSDTIADGIAEEPSPCQHNRPC